MTHQTTTNAAVSTAVQAVNGLTNRHPATPETVTLDLGGGTYTSDTHVNAHPGATLIITNGTLVGGSPALIVDSGNVISSGVTAPAPPIRRPSSSTAVSSRSAIARSRNRPATPGSHLDHRRHGRSRDRRQPRRQHLQRQRRWESHPELERRRWFRPSAIRSRTTARSHRRFSY